MTSQGICTKYIRSNLDANRHVQVDAYGPDDKDGRGRECSVKGWCGDNESCLLASQYVLHAEYYSQCILVENNAIIWQTYSFNTNPIWDELFSGRGSARVQISTEPRVLHVQGFRHKKLFHSLEAGCGACGVRYDSTSQFCNLHISSSSFPIFAPR